MTGSISVKRSLDAAGEWVLTPVYRVDGVEVTEAAYREQFPEHDGAGVQLGTGAGYPHESAAMGVHPRQVAAATEYARKVGIPTDYTADGKAVMRSREHRREFLKHHGMHDNNACGRV